MKSTKTKIKKGQIEDYISDSTEQALLGKVPNETLSGTEGFLQKSTLEKVLVNSQIYELEGKIAIGKLTPTEELDVNGNIKGDSFIKKDGTPEEILKADGSTEVEVIDYNYNIIRDLDPDSNAVFLTKEYVLGTTKVFLNGMRLTRGNYYDYREGTGNIIIMNYPLEVEDLLIVDYRSITI